MSDNQVKKLLEACSSDPELLNKLQNTMPEDALSVVQAMGYDISQEDIEKLSSSVSEDLTDAELEAAAGDYQEGSFADLHSFNILFILGKSIRSCG